MAYVTKFFYDDGRYDYEIEDSHSGFYGFIAPEECAEIKEQYGVDENSEHLKDVVKKYRQMLFEKMGGPVLRVR